MPDKAITQTGEVRSKTIAVRVSPAQEQRLNELAMGCGMSRSSYMLARSYNYKPKARLTSEDRKLLETLVGVRTDVQNYSNAMQALSREERINLFHNYPFMLKWLRSLYQMKEHVVVVLNRMFAPNRVPNGCETNCGDDCDCNDDITATGTSTNL